MTIARNRQICLEATPYYHCICRCVRRAYLCGNDAITGRSFEHRRAWIEQRLLELADVFAIDVVAYAVMNNHYHVILHVDGDKAKLWTGSEVIDRWSRLYGLPDVVKRAVAGELLSTEDNAAVAAKVETWRARLMDLSWFMKCTNYEIAVKANREDECSGRFWEGRFESQALLDESALVQCMAYIDLNPVRSKIAKTPEQSEYTSVKCRIDLADHCLMPFRGNDFSSRGEFRKVLPCTFDDYLALIDWTGRIIIEGKRGAISAGAPPILERLGTNTSRWIQAMEPGRSWRQRALGSAVKISQYCNAIGQKWLWQVRPSLITA
jgi:REP element-mobilizing transposase RayT